MHPRLDFCTMERVRGIGGIFFKARDPKALAEWYAQNLGLPVEDFGAAIFRVTSEDADQGAVTVFSPFPADTDYFEPSRSAFMINFRVDNLDLMLAQLRAAGADVHATIQVEPHGRFGWVMDPELNRIELWEPASDHETSSSEAD
jgi:predicted enzyme related to lactoylglutathione lyase